MKTNGDDTITAIEANALGHVGLTKREHFAALAMQGLAASDVVQTYLRDENPTKDGADKIAISAVQMANALIAELNKDKGEV